MSGGELVVLDRNGRDVKRYSLPDGLATIGSDPACDICVMLASVSPHHATIVVHANQVRCCFIHNNFYVQLKVTAITSILLVSTLKLQCCLGFQESMLSINCGISSALKQQKLPIFTYLLFLYYFIHKLLAESF